MFLDSLEYWPSLIAFLVTAVIHLTWSEIVWALLEQALVSLSNPASPVLVKMLRLQSLVLTAIVFALCFKTTSAGPAQHILQSNQFNGTLQFDDIETSHGLGNLTRPYQHLVFYGFHPFLPGDSALQGHISPVDHNCASSPPNALLGTTLLFLDLDSEDVARPLIITNASSLSGAGLSPFFTLKGMMIKPMHNVNYDRTPQWTLHIWGYRADGEIYKWSVIFPSSFHEMFPVRLERFTRKRWDMLKHVEIWTAWEEDYMTRTWQFCMDDMEVEFSRAD